MAGATDFFLEDSKPPGGLLDMARWPRPNPYNPVASGTAQCLTSRANSKQSAAYSSLMTSVRAGHRPWRWTPVGGPGT